MVASAAQAKIFGVPISASFTSSVSYLHDLGGNQTSTRILCLVLTILMGASTFITQRQLMARNGPAEGQMAQQQKIMLYLFPVLFLFYGFKFPIGVLIYWLTTNVWSMAQQSVVIRRMDTPEPVAAAQRPRTLRARSRGRNRSSGPAPSKATPPAKGPTEVRYATEVRAPRSAAHHRRAVRRSRRPRRRPIRPGRIPRVEHQRFLRINPPKPGQTSFTTRRLPAARQSHQKPQPTRTTMTTDTTASDQPDSGIDAESDNDPVPSGTDPTDTAQLLEREGDIAADYLEVLLDIADLDGDIDIDVDNDRAAVSIIGSGLGGLVGPGGATLDALQELTRLAVHRETGVRTRLMLDVGGHRARRRAELTELGPPPPNACWSRARASGWRR